jgi:Icc-related predicted phosphoesterase
MKILAIGDPHGYENIKNIQIDSDIELILITGDLAESDFIRKAFFKAREQGISDFRKTMTKKELNQLYEKFVNSALDVLKYFEKSGKPVYYVYGNLFGMEYCIMKRQIKNNNLKITNFEKEIKKLKNTKNIELKNAEFGGLKIAGVPYFDNKDWNKTFDPEDEKKKEFAKWQEPKISNFLNSLGKTDILLTHIPPYGFLDKVTSKFAPNDWQGKHAGSKAILDYIKRYQPKLVLCGHIHEAKGKVKIGKTKIYNLGCCGDYEILEI